MEVKGDNIDNENDGHDKTFQYEQKEKGNRYPLLEKINIISQVDSSELGIDKSQNNNFKSLENNANKNKSNLSLCVVTNEDANSASEGIKFLGINDKDSICSSQSPQEIEPQIPDGGWGWVVVAASFLIATVADGLGFSYGLIHNEFVIFFGASEAKTSLIGSLFISVPLIAGPIMSALVDRYGCRNMTIIGGMVSTIGFVAASYSNSVEILYVTYGIIAGLGMGLLYVTCVVSIAYWFEKRRNLAVGLGSCGVGFGTFLYSPLTMYLLREYGWRGTLLLLAGTVLQVCICGAVMRDPEWLMLEQKRQRKLNKSKKISSNLSISAKSGAGESVYPGVEELKTLMESGETPD